MLVRVASPAAPPLLGDVVIVVAGLVRLWEAGVRLMTPTSRSGAPEGPGKGGGSTDPARTRSPLWSQSPEVSTLDALKPDVRHHFSVMHPNRVLAS